MSVLSRFTACGVAALLALSLAACESKDPEKVAQAAGQPEVTEKCDALPEGIDNGILGDEPGQPGYEAQAHKQQVILGSDPVRIDLLDGAVAPDGQTPKVASLSMPDLGTAKVCEGRWLVYTPGDETSLQGEVGMRYCLENGDAFTGCNSVDITAVSASTAQVMDEVTERGLQAVPYQLTSSATRKVMRDAGMTDEEFLRYQAYNDAFWAKALTFGDDFAQRVVIASQCFGLPGTLKEQFKIMGESLQFTVEGLENATAELDALTEGVAPDVSPDIGEQAKKQVTLTFLIHDVIQASTTDGAGGGGKQLVKAGLREVPGGQWVADPYGEFCTWASKEAFATLN